jgi:ABC-type amino acid transport substrate-binding protein
MKKKSVIRKMGCLAIAVVTLFSLTSCGEKSESNDVTKIVVATGQLFTPYCYTDDNGELTGYDVAVLKALDEIMPDYEFDIQGMGFDTCIVSLDSGAVDMVAFELGKNAETYNNVASEIGIDNLMMTEPVLVQEEYFMINKDEVEFCDAQYT